MTDLLNPELGDMMTDVGIILLIIATTMAILRTDRRK